MKTFPAFALFLCNHFSDEHSSGIFIQAISGFFYEVDEQLMDLEVCGSVDG